jgi:hypothetical protein
MTVAMQKVMDAFDALPDADKHQAAFEILRRLPGEGDLPDSALVETAEQLFQPSDAEEVGQVAWR